MTMLHTADLVGRQPGDPFLAAAEQSQMLAPPAEWFQHEPADWEPWTNPDHPVTYIGTDGRFAAMLAPYDVCLLDAPRSAGQGCWTAPKSQTAYARAHAGKMTDFADGTSAETAWICADISHADGSERPQQRQAAFDDTSKQKARVRYIDRPDLGCILALGAVVPHLSTWDAVKLKASGLSGEWFPFEDLRESELIGSIVVSEQGFRRQFAASITRSSHRYRAAAVGAGVWITDWKVAAPADAPAEDPAVLEERVELGHVLTVTPQMAAALVESFDDSPADHVDLALLDIAGTPETIFASVAANTLARGDMPQIPDEHLAAFDEQVGVELVEIDPFEVSATQRDLNGSKVGGMLRSMRAEKMSGAEPLISGDARVIDGHHRWAAAAIRRALGETSTMRARRSKLPQAELLDAARKFADEVGSQARDVRDAPKEASMHDNDAHVAHPGHPNGQHGNRWAYDENGKRIAPLKPGEFRGRTRAQNRANRAKGHWTRTHHPLAADRKGTTAAMEDIEFIARPAEGGGIVFFDPDTKVAVADDDPRLIAFRNPELEQADIELEEAEAELEDAEHDHEELPVAAATEVPCVDCQEREKVEVEVAAPGDGKPPFPPKADTPKAPEAPKSPATNQTNHTVPEHEHRDVTDAIAELKEMFEEVRAMVIARETKD